MTQPTTIRLPEDLLEEAVLAYREGRLSLAEAARRLGLDPWAWFDLLRRRNETLNVELEDWIDARSAL
jgi:predicted HTH domain antitoxin